MIKDLIKEKFKFGSYVHAYYRYLNKFHCEPKSWQDLLEFGNFIDVENKIHKLIADSTKQEN